MNALNFIFEFDSELVFAENALNPIFKLDSYEVLAKNMLMSYLRHKKRKNPDNILGSNCEHIQCQPRICIRLFL